MKKNILIKDSALNKIIDLSSFAFKCAEDRLVNNIFITKQLCDECILKFNDLYNDVKSFNKNLAMWYVSQATVDLTYASNQTDGMSDRVSHIKN